MAALTDDAVTTHHFIRLSGGVPTNVWSSADYSAVEALFNTWWGSINARWDNNTVLKQFRWYLAGPSVTKPNPPQRVTNGTVGGDLANVEVLPPQVAVSITEKTSDPGSWGRFYLPAPAVGVGQIHSGRITTSYVTQWATFTQTLYNGLSTGGFPAVVYSAAKPERERKDHTLLPAIAARALGVSAIQVDDVYDVIRSRRWPTPNFRSTLAIT